MKIALVKQDIYQDLYVCAKNEKPFTILKSTLMRIGPLALFTDYGADFYIIKEQSEHECRAWKHSFRVPSDLKEQLKNLPANKLTAFNFKYLQSLSENSHKDFAIAPDDIDWSVYDIVISINIAVPTRIVKKHPNTLWCYMYGEANADTSCVRFGYDAVLTQNLTGEVADRPGKIDFPYTFLSDTTLEHIAEQAFGPAGDKTGVYAEINNTEERPVLDVPCMHFIKETGHSLVLHSQNIITNTERLYHSKYFVKAAGRKIRGNSVIEAISAGTLVLINPKDVMHSQLLPKETWVHSEAEIIKKIKELDADPDYYLHLLNKQRELLRFFVIDTPMESLKNALAAKRLGITPQKTSFKQKIKQAIRVFYE